MLHNLLFFVPVVALSTILLLYRLNGKKEFIRFDLVQFIYAFIMTPIVFIWLKAFLYFILRRELGYGLSPGQLFTIDTIFSTVFLYVFAFIVIHSLTKSFQLKSYHDPLYDMFHHSEYFHLWLTHIVTYVGGMMIMAFLATMNAFFPLDFQMPAQLFYLSIGTGILIGLVLIVGLWLSDPRQDHANFMRLMKLFIAAFFSELVIVQFYSDPDFTSRYVIFWWVLTVFATGVVVSGLVYKSTKAQSFFDRVVSKLSPHHSLYENIQLFKKR